MLLSESMCDVITECMCRCLCQCFGLLSSKMSINVGQQASDFLVRDWLMMLMMSSTNGGFERHKFRLVLVDEFPGFYTTDCLKGNKL